MSQNDLTSIYSESHLTGEWLLEQASPTYHIGILLGKADMRKIRQFQLTEKITKKNKSSWVKVTHFDLLEVKHHVLKAGTSLRGPREIIWN